MTIENTYAEVQLSINLTNLIDNYNLIRNVIQGIDCVPVVKADAYGLGADKIVLALAKAGCKQFFVATADEGIALRHLLPDIAIHVFHGPNNHNKEAFRVYNMIPVINSLEQFHTWNNYGMDIANVLPAFLHIDTGMNRLGMTFEELKTNLSKIRQAEGIKWLYLMSHLACADNPNHTLNKHQLEQFQQARRLFPFIKGSLANSSGIFLGKNYLFHSVRPGAALYGINPTPYAQNPMKPVVSLKGKIIQHRYVNEPGTVSYSGTHQVEPGARIAIVPIGYADGYLRSLSNRPSIVSIGGHRAPIIGVVTMDSIMIDVSHIPHELCQPGKEVQLMGGDIPLEETAQAAGTIAYEMITCLGNRFKREYVSDAAPAKQNILTQA
ncbi:MAG: alanine racemase [Alphaproteobacteria bacterium]|nr:alanine racemase [Alphaproteobacteria bacterium]